MWRTFGSMDFKWLQNSKNEVLSLNTTHPSCHTILRGPRIFKSDQVRAPQLYLPEWDRNPSQHWRESPAAAEHSKASPWMESIQQGVPAMWEKMVKPKARKIRKYSQFYYFKDWIGSIVGKLWSITFGEAADVSMIVWAESLLHLWWFTVCFCPHVLPMKWLLHFLDTLW